MSDRLETDIAIVGAGPIGVEAALYALRRGHRVRLFERDVPGANLRRWSHVEFFSPWHMNRSEWGLAHLRERGIELAPDDAFPTAARYLRTYLEPIAESSPVADHLECGCEVLEIARRDALKPEHVASPARADGPFVLRVDDGDRRRFVEAETVLDTTGVYDHPNGLGPGGTRAIGEQRLADAIDYRIPDVLGDERDRYRDRHTLVVGAGHSAVTTLRDLHELRADAPGTEITWLLRGDDPPYTVRDDDPLPMRRRLARFGNGIVAGEVDGISTRFGLVERLERPDAGRLAVDYRRGDQRTRTEIDRLVANVGYRPDLELFRELQVHTCYATEGPIDLAASLLAQSGDADCLDQSTGGLEQLRVPEPNFFVLGSKSYGRHSNFLLRVGFEQIEQVFTSPPELS